MYGRVGLRKTYAWPPSALNATQPNAFGIFVIDKLRCYYRTVYFNAFVIGKYSTKCIVVGPTRPLNVQ